MPGFICPICTAISFHPRDGEEGYCARCAAYTVGDFPGVRMRQFTVYARPADWPDGYVVREWMIVSLQPEPLSGRVWTSPTIDGARQRIPDGMVCFAATPNDDPTIVETWM